ncbi:MAG TPA: alpha/beta hydrolase [Kribbellaceae bacterium]|nr:alpha/beta hydrolase [Kribbellaceae bacterium]
MIQVHPRQSGRSRLVRIGARAIVRPVLGFYPVSGPAAPLAELVDLGMRVLPRLSSTIVEHVNGGDWKAELVSVKSGAEHAGKDADDTGRAAILYFHGGAFVACGLATHRRIAERLAERTGLPVLSVAYRQRSHHVDTSIRDCIEAVNLLVDRGFDPAQLVLAGDSAGGHLAFAVAIEAVAQQVRVAGVVALSPWLEFDNSVRRRHRNALRDDFIPAYRLQRMAHRVTGGRPLDPLASPVNADLTGLPPALIMCAADEILRFDAELMTERLEAAGVPAELHVWQGQVHAFPVFAHLLPESRAALDRIAAFVTDVVAAARAEDTELAS